MNYRSELGLSHKDIARISPTLAVRALLNPADRELQRLAGHTLEVSRAEQMRSGKILPGLGFSLPAEYVAQPARRDLTVGTDSAGGYLKGTAHMGSAFIDVLRNRSMVAAMGATYLPGLIGDVAIPKRTAGAAASWLGESGSPTEGSSTFAQVPLAFHAVGAYVDASYRLLKQSSPSVDALLIDDIAASLSTAIDRAALHGSGADNEPTGIATTSGVGRVEGGTNGAAPTVAHLLAMESSVAEANADLGAMAYLTNPLVRRKLKQTFANSTGGDTPIWEGRPNGEGEVCGYRAGATNQVSSTLSQGTSTGVCSAIFFGNWADLIIALWGGLDILIDRASLSTQGAVRIVGLQACDIGVRHPGSFSVMLDALTA